MSTNECRIELPALPWLNFNLRRLLSLGLPIWDMPKYRIDFGPQEFILSNDVCKILRLDDRMLYVIIADAAAALMKSSSDYAFPLPLLLASLQVQDPCLIKNDLKDLCEALDNCCVQEADYWQDLVSPHCKASFRQYYAYITLVQRFLQKPDLYIFESVRSSHGRREFRVPVPGQLDRPGVYQAANHVIVHYHYNWNGKRIHKQIRVTDICEIEERGVCFQDQLQMPSETLFSSKDETATNRDEDFRRSSPYD
ncbi:hypothetical protein H2198_002069 [Neophaeococcomyces mojaviensis]|uniref:Uncharacterized protein n=1 Tax=Neophaeococcomyces mojaviensis TaxID=3383035 RepID=A0ACC3AFC0_9EURO|nr:hypothetical protein H2198_002069 [Knufia sp. JES_112]